MTLRSSEQYLGDGLYVSFVDMGTFRLRAPRDDGDHVVYLDLNMLELLNQIVQRFTSNRATPVENEDA